MPYTDANKEHDSDGNPWPATTSTRGHSEGVVTWATFSGSKKYGYDVNADQMNADNKNIGEFGEHTWYNPKSGRMGVKGGDSPRKK